MKKSTAIRSLLLSGLSMLLCFSMLMGSTFAWFTDEVKSGTNTIIAGNLDVELYHSDKNASDVKVDSTTVLFDDVDSNKWEPGAMAWEKFTVVNEGNLALKYQLTLNALNATLINGTSFASMLKVAVVDGTFTYTRENVAAIDADKWSDLATFTLEGKLEKQGDEAIHGIIIWWQPSDNDNLFNMNNANSGKKVSVDVGVNLFATQLDAENDSFGPEYDEDAVFADHYVTDATELQDAINNAANGDIIALMGDIDLSGASTFALRAAEQYGLVVAEGTKVVIDLNGYSVTYGSTVGAKTAVIANNGNLTIKDSVGTGKIVLTEAVVDPAYGYATDVIYNNGNLVVEGGTLSLALGGASYAIDNNSGATATINGGYVENTAGTAIRVYSWSATDASTLVVNGGEIVGTYGIRLHNLSTSVASKMNVTINGGAITGTDPTYGMALYSLCNDGINTNIAINGGTYYGDIALGGGNKVNPENFTINADNCTIYGEVYSYNTTVGDILGNEQTVVAITNVDELKTLLTNGGEGILACDLELDADETITVPANVTVTLDLNGKTIAGVSDQTGKNKSVIVVGKGGDLTLKNGTVTIEHVGANMGWNNSTNALEAVSGGKLTIDHVTVKNLGGSDMAYAVNVGNNGGATFKAIASTIESVNYNAFRVFNNADGAITVDFTEGTVLTGSGSPFFVHFWTEADLGAKQETRQAYLTVNFNDTVVSRYSGSKSLIRFGFTNAIYFSSTDMTEVVAGSEAALAWAFANGKNVLLNNDIALTETATVPAGKTVILDLNGKTVSGACNASQGYLFMVNNGAKLTVLDSSADESGKITFAQGTSNVGWAIDLEGELVLESGTIELTGDSWSIGYAVDVRPNAWGTAYQYPTVFTMNGGKVVSSDGAIRVASSSSETYTGVSAKFVMNGGEVEAAWDGIFVQQSNAVYDILTVELNGGKVASALSPVRVYGPVATSVVGGAEKPMTLKIGAAAELSVIGEIDTTRTWYKNGVVVLGGGMTVEALEQYSTIVIAE